MSRPVLRLARLAGLVLGAAPVVLLAACQKAPPEPAPPPASASAPAERPASELGAAGQGAGTGAFGSRAPDAAARCVAPLAETAPATPPKAEGRCPKDPSGNLPLAKAKVAFPDAPRAPAVTVELAESPDAIERGLMYRKQMAEDEGMLFRMGQRKVQTFWMHNTCLPLDLLFVDDDGFLVGVAESAPVLDDGIRSVPCPSAYVLEVNAGFVRRHGVAPGQRVALP